MPGFTRSAAVLVLLLSAPTLARADIAPPRVRLPLRAYTTSDGLSGDDVTALLADSRGFLWVGTTTGLNRFDGRDFKRYGRSEGLPTLRITALVEDRHGTIWVGTQEGLARIEPQRHVVTVVPVGSGTRIFRLMLARNGDIWVAAGEEVFFFDPRAVADARRVELSIIAKPLDPPFVVEALAEGREGDVWIGTSYGMLRRLPDGRIVRIAVRLPSEQDRVFHLAVDNDGRVWITHWGLAHLPNVHFGVYVLTPHTVDRADLDAINPLHERARRIIGRAALPLPRAPGEVIYTTAAGPLGDGRVFAVQPASDATWITTATGPFRVEDERVTAFDDAAQGLRLPIRVGLQDDRGGLWLGTAGFGLLRVGLNGIAVFGERTGVPPGSVVGLFEDATGTLCLVGTDINGRRWFGAMTAAGVVEFEPKGTAGINYWGWGWHQIYLRSRDSEYWVATGNGLLRYPAAPSCTSLASTPPVAWYRAGNGLPYDEVFRLFEDSRGDVWISAGRLVRWVRATGAFERIPGHEDAPSAFAEDQAGNVWIGFFRGGIGRWRAGTFEYFGVHRGLPPGQIQALFVDRAGRLWIGSERGLRYAANTNAPEPWFQPLTDALADTSAYAFLEARDRQLYVATAQGVLRLNEDLAITRRYTVGDGLPGYETKIAYEDRRGDLWFGWVRGFARLRPQRAQLEERVIVLIDRLAIGGAPQPTPLLGADAIAGIVVSPGNRRVEISYASPNLTPGATPAYSTRLRNVDAVWSPPSMETTVTYANLEPGSYEFEVRALLDGRVSERTATLSFTIVPPIWQRRWVQWAGMLLMLTAGYGAYRLRVERLLALERVRTRIATDLHDDLGARLSRISILSEVAARRAATDASSARRLLSDVGETARSLLEATADMTWSVDPRHDDVGSLAARVRGFAADLLDGRDIQWTFDVPPEAVSIKLTLEQRRQVLLVFQEAINNAVKHSRAGHVTLGLTAENHRLDATIVDDGCGFDVDNTTASPTGNGLTNMARRARELGGTLTIHSRPGRTVVHLSLPLT